MFEDFKELILKNNLPLPGTVITTPNRDELVVDGYEITTDIRIVLHKNDEFQFEVHWDIDTVSKCDWDGKIVSNENTVILDSVSTGGAYPVTFEIFKNKLNPDNVYYAKLLINDSETISFFRNDKPVRDDVIRNLVWFRNNESPVFWSKIVALLKKYGFEKFIP